MERQPVNDEAEAEADDDADATAASSGGLPVVADSADPATAAARAARASAAESWRAGSSGMISAVPGDDRENVDGLLICDCACATVGRPLLLCERSLDGLDSGRAGAAPSDWRRDTSGT